jgi:predicted dienelactone hydrolase
MKWFHKLGAACIVLIAGAGFTATRLTPVQAATTPNGETPELGRMGELAVGTQSLELSFPARPKITIVGALTGRLPLETRAVGVRLWYPATRAEGGVPTRYRHVVTNAGKPDFVVDTQGRAVEGATPLSGGARYPLVVVSHGYRGWASHYSQLAETLASKGYVVAAIDHRDAGFNNAQTFQLSFGNVMLDRAQDQRQVVAELIGRAQTGTGWAGLIDAEKIGLIGYSMGGYGALATAGAPYDLAGKTMKQLPAQAQTATTRGADETVPKIKALVTLAPWGGQPDNRVWSAVDLSKITAPVLMISGDTDDVVNFDHGVSWIFDNLTGTDRSLLVYQAARHNIVGNPVPVTEDMDFSTMEFFTEPVWRPERLNQINQHFIAAFLDLHLKGDAAKAAYLDVPTSSAARGDWPSPPGAQLGGRFADAAQPNYWRGFQRRWAMGLTMHKAAKGARGRVERVDTPVTP